MRDYVNFDKEIEKQYNRFLSCNTMDETELGHFFAVVYEEALWYNGHNGFKWSFKQCIKYALLTRLAEHNGRKGGS